MLLKVFPVAAARQFFRHPHRRTPVMGCRSFFRGPPSYDAAGEMPLFRLFGTIHGWPGVLFAWILVVGQAFYLNYLINKYEVLYKPSFLPAFLYVLLMSFSNKVMWLHPAIFANLLILVSFDKAFSLFKHPAPIRLLFEGSFFSGLAFLFYYPALVFYLLLLLALGIIRSLSIREWMVTFVGFLLPLYFACVWFFWQGTLPGFLAALKPRFPISNCFPA
jgi:hypothetical protein